MIKDWIIDAEHSLLSINLIINCQCGYGLFTEPRLMKHIESQTNENTFNILLHKAATVIF